MRNKKIDRMKRNLAILLLLGFALSVTAASASAADNINHGKSQKGYIDGYNKGYEDGKIQGQKDCEQYGITDILSKIPSPYNEYSWLKDYRDSYNIGYEKGYIDGYNQIRYGCLK
jgi:flagellar biosynthesis/type III secretory pathway protein FliH